MSNHWLLVRLAIGALAISWCLAVSGCGNTTAVPGKSPIVTPDSEAYAKAKAQADQVDAENAAAEAAAAKKRTANLPRE